MKTLLSTRTLAVAEGCTVTIKSKVVTVKGTRGELTREFKHLDVDVRTIEDGTKIQVDMWFAKRKQLASVRTIVSHINNMMIGLTQGFRYKMRLVYNHFPINATINGQVFEVRNFIGQRIAFKCECPPSVKLTRSADVKDQVELEGSDIVALSLSAARIQQMTAVKNKDIRKFLDGIYIEEKGNIIALQ